MGVMPKQGDQSRKGVAGMEGKAKRSRKIQQKQEFSSEVTVENLSHPKTHPQDIEKNLCFPPYVGQGFEVRNKNLKIYISKASMSPAVWGDLGISM